MADLQTLLQERDWLLADGATGTNFFQMGLLSGDAPELWNTDAPEKVKALHRSFLEAGSDIILTNTFGCNARRLRLHDADSRVHELNMAAARLAREVADEFDRPIVIAGSVGPTGDLFEPLGELTFDAAVACFKEQMEGLAEGGADVMWVETMSAAEEMQAAAQAATQLGLPYTTTASFDTAGKTMMGLEPSALGAVFNDVQPAAIGIGANCGVGASDLLVSILGMTEANPDAIVIAKANCGIPEVRGDEVVYTGTPELMANYARLAIDAGARIVGGCCGTTAEHLASMRAALEGYQRGPRPDRAKIEAEIGPLTNPPVEAAISERRRSRRRARD